MVKTKIFYKLINVLLIFSLTFSTAADITFAEVQDNQETANQTVDGSFDVEPTPGESLSQLPVVQDEDELNDENPDYIGKNDLAENTLPMEIGPTAIPTPTKIPEPGDPNRTQSATSAYTLGVETKPTAAITQNNTIGDPEIKTGDATATANVLNNANTNLGTNTPSASLSGGGGGASVVNSANGTNSDNNGSISIENNNDTNQNNSAYVNTDLSEDATTGSNSTSYNVGNSSIDTGDANVTGTVVTFVNTNASGILVSEFNVADDHIGDIILDFVANCVAGCGGGDLKTANTGNGSYSDNTSSIDTTTNNNTTQNNDANIGSSLNLTADSGNNTASYNTGGDSDITTGDANVAANVLTFANNNIAGDVIYGVVNIFGDLIGDIIFPEDALNCCGGNVTAENTGNGSGSTNDADINVENNDNTIQTNTANIKNDLVFDAQSGNNSASKNTGGDSSITTGDTSVDANVLNIVNSNLLAGNMWLVLVNEAGNWIGKILGAPEGQNFAGSAGTEFNVDEQGYITASNNSNGTGSENTSSVNQTNTDTTVQNNNATVNNKLNLSANTGENSTSNNTGGNSDITTGDASIVANLVNFVNNNIKGNGRLFVTVVNVFGNWLGDFVAPGQTKVVKEELSQNTQNTQNLGGSLVNGNQNIHDASSAKSGIKNAAASAGNGVVYVSPTNAAVSNNISEGFANQPAGSYTSANDAKVLGAAVQRGDALSITESAKKVRINLAWLIIVLPIFMIGIVLKRTILPRYLKKS